MRLDLDGLTVFFPYDRIYQEQYDYMKHLKCALDSGSCCNKKKTGGDTNTNGSGGDADIAKQLSDSNATATDKGESGGNSASVEAGEGNGGGHCVLEMPTGTGKTACLLSLITSYQYAADAASGSGSAGNISQRRSSCRRKLVYATKTVPEMDHVSSELVSVLNYRIHELKKEEEIKQESQLEQHETPVPMKVESSSFVPIKVESSSSVPIKVESSSFVPIKVESSASIVNAETTDEPLRKKQKQTTNSSSPSVMDYRNGDGSVFLALRLSACDEKDIEAARRHVNAAALLKNEGNVNAIPMTTTTTDPLPCGVHDLDSLRSFWKNSYSSGSSSSATSFQQLLVTCLSNASIFIVTYPYLLHPKRSKLISNEFAASDNDNQNHNIVVFDEAHNIDAICMDALSITLTDRDLEQATRNLGRLGSELIRLLSAQQQQQQQQQQQPQPQSMIHPSNAAATAAAAAAKMAIQANANNNGYVAAEEMKCQQQLHHPLDIEYQRLIRSPIDEAIFGPSNVLDVEVVREPVPGNIRRAKHFVGFLKKVVEHLKSCLRSISGPNINRGQVRTQTPLAFLHRMTNATSIGTKPLRFSHARLTSLLRTIQATAVAAAAAAATNNNGVSGGGSLNSSFHGVPISTDSTSALNTTITTAMEQEYQALLVVSEFASLLATFCAAGNKSRFAIIMEPEPINNNPNESSGSVIQLVCLDASLAIAPLFQRFNSVVITSSTLSPIDLYPKLLQFKPCVSVSLEISQFRPCIRPLMISRGSDQLAVSTKQDDRVDIGVIRNFGAILVELCSCVPDGIVAYFTSYSYMEALISEWDGMGILRELTKHKLVIIETKNVVETTIALDNFRVACDSGRGAVFLAVVRGMVSEGVPFDRHYGRAKIMFGLPYQYTLSHIVRARLEYLQTNLQIREQDFLTFDAIRQVAKCFGRILRSKSDYGLLIFADSRFSRMDKRSQLPKWMVQSLSEAHLNLSTDVAVQYAKSFLRIMGQPIAQEALQSVLLKLEDVRQMEGSIPNASTTATSVPLMAISSQPLSKTEPVGV